MVEHPGEYIWSSYATNGQGALSDMIQSHPIYAQLGSSAENRQEAYRELFRHRMDKETLQEIRDALNHELVLGRSYFKDKIEKMTKRATRLGQPGRPKVKEETGQYYIFC